MKRIKLFENFSVLNPIDVRDDIKSVLYELEDMGLDVSFNALVSIPGTEIKMETCFMLDANKIEPEHIVDFFTISARKNAEFTTDVKEKLKWFHELLIDHLDYINPKKIRLENAGRYISVSL
jgi:hypothetical protein